MTTNIKTFNSKGGFGVENKTIISGTYDLKNVNSFEVKNSNHDNCKRVDYLLKNFTNQSTPNTILSLTSSSLSPILLNSESVNFVTAHVLATNSDLSGYYSLKVENTVLVDNFGNVTSLSSLRTILKDNIPSGDTWTVAPYDSGSSNQFSYSVNQGTSTDSITWVSHIQVVSTQI